MAPAALSAHAPRGGHRGTQCFGFADRQADRDRSYNTTCEIRATLVEGDWSDEDYSRGYAEGQTEGAFACNADKEAGTVS